jgi:glycerol-3-phosphate dehydrogenase (NAD(P)+)
VLGTLQSRHENEKYLPGVRLPDEVVATSDLNRVLAADAVLVAVPAQRLRAALGSLSSAVRPAVPLVLCAKGIERGSGKLVTEILQETAPQASGAVLSGPSFAADVARGKPTAVVIGAQDPAIAGRLQATLSTASFRPYASQDVTGVALGGAAKNVYAIACGIVDGLGLGESARAALLARSFAELMRFGETLGARRETLMGLSGLGDLVLTATSLNSRNYAHGSKLGRGEIRAGATAAHEPLVEGVPTAPALLARAKALSIELPVAEATAAVLDGTLTPRDALIRLMSRPLKTE